jgi:DNA polymerase I-like protein with 3'-5' exonuclease and polymerase domains
MTPQPTTLSSNLSALSKTLASAQEIVFDFETSNVKPREAALVGLGIYVPEVDRAFYINIGSMDRDGEFPLYKPSELADALRDFFLDPQRHAIAHNFSYDCRCLIQLGIEEVCQQPAFRDCRLILTVHDSLVYEVPKSIWRDFVRAARPIMNRRPYWADIDMKVDVEFGTRFGNMRKV